MLITKGEIEICRYITSQLPSSKYYCYWYDDLNAAFFNNNGYNETINSVQENKMAFSLLTSIIVMLRDAPQYGDVTIRDIITACTALGIPLIHVVYFSEQNHPNVIQFVKMSTNFLLYIPNHHQKPTTRVNEFNILKFQYQSNPELYTRYANVYLSLRDQQNVGNFMVLLQNNDDDDEEDDDAIIIFNNYNEISRQLKLILNVPCMQSLFKSHVKIHRKSYSMGYIRCLDQIKLGNFMAIYNRYMIRSNQLHYCIAFSYKVVPITRSSSKKIPPLYHTTPNSEQLIKMLTLHQPPNIILDNKNILPSYYEMKTSYEDYKKTVEHHLMINFKLDNTDARVFATYTGIVLHAHLLVKGSICTEKIINKPLVRFISKYKTITCSYYKEVDEANEFNYVKFNFNCQGEDFFIRCKLLGFYTKLQNICDFAHSNDKLIVSNQRGHIRGLHSGVINVHTHRTKMVYNELNCFKVPCFPAIKLVDETQYVVSRDNIIHRETILTCIHKNLSMIENIDMIKNIMYPHCERIEELHDIVYKVESTLKMILIGPLLGILKMFYLYYRNHNNILCDYFINKLWINQYIIAQNGCLGRAPMCHRIKDTTAIKCTSIKTLKKPQMPQPPYVDDPKLLQKISNTFEDAAIGTLNPRLWKGRGAFSYLNVLIQAPTKLIYGETGRTFVNELYKMLQEHGGDFKDSYALLDIFKSFQNNKKK